MSTDVALRRMPTPRRTPLPVLIEVPALSSRKQTPRRPQSVRRRRRLRREVRLAVLVLLAGGPVLGGLLMIVRGGSVPGLGAPSAPAAPVVRLSPRLEVDWSAPGLEITAPLVRPAGYLLPAGSDDRPEETAHAGT